MQFQCPNCGKRHESAGNHYCVDCAATFERWGMFTYIDADGLRSVIDSPEEKTCGNSQTIS